MPSQSLVPLPLCILSWHRNVTICVDIFFIHGVPFVHTILRDIKLRTVEEISNRTYKSLLNSIQNVFELYLARGFVVEHLRGDGEFKCIEDSIKPTRLHIATKGQHVPEIERSIRTVKERIRGTMHGLPFQYYPRNMLIYLVLYTIKLLNAFPANDGISKTLSPFTIMTGEPSLSYHDLPLEFGQHVQCHDDNPTASNTTQARTTGAIALCSANYNKSWYFFSLNSGHIITRSNYHILPLPQEALQRIYDLAQSESNTPIPNKPLFEYSPGVPIDDEDNDVPIIIDDDFSERAQVNEQQQSEQNENNVPIFNDTNNFYNILGDISDDTEEHNTTETAEHDNEDNVSTNNMDNAENNRLSHAQVCRIAFLPT